MKLLICIIIPHALYIKYEWVWSINIFWSQFQFFCIGYCFRFYYFKLVVLLALKKIIKSDFTGNFYNCFFLYSSHMQGSTLTVFWLPRTSKMMFNMDAWQLWWHLSNLKHRSLEYDVQSYCRSADILQIETLVIMTNFLVKIIYI